MQEMKEELREERNKRLALQVSEACLEFCIPLHLLPTAQKKNTEVVVSKIMS